MLEELELAVQQNDDEMRAFAPISNELIDNGCNMAIVYYTHTHEVSTQSDFTNIPIALMTTAQARLHLLSEMEKIGEDRVLYFDTDSIYYIDHTEDLAEYKPKTGLFLGEWVNDLPADAHITEFCSAGPKNYTYRMNDGTVVHKHKGISLNAGAIDALSFDIIRDMVLNVTYGFDDENMPSNVPLTIPIKQFTIKRNKNLFTLQTVFYDKQYRVYYDKRVISKERDMKTYPYGHSYCTIAENNLYYNNYILTIMHKLFIVLIIEIVQ